MFEANYLTILLKPNYEKAIDTAQDVIDRNLSVIFPPGSESVKKTDENSPYYLIRSIAEMAVVPKVIVCYVTKFPIIYNIKFS